MPPDIPIEKTKARKIELSISSERIKIFSFRKKHWNHTNEIFQISSTCFLTPDPPSIALISMASPKEVGVEYIRVRLKLFEKCYMESLLHGLHAWHISTKEVKEIERIQSRYLKMLLELPASTPTAALYLETGIWPVTERIEYLTSMLYQNMSKRKEIAPLITQHQQMSSTKNSTREDETDSKMY